MFRELAVPRVDRLLAACDPLGVPGRELLRHGLSGLHENHAEVCVSDYSYRSATIGSTRDARCAGRNAASSAIATKDIVASINSEMSVGMMP
jgi:hypothetical protein